MGLDKFVDWVVVLWGVPSLVAAGVFYLLYRTLKTAGKHQGDKDWLAQKAKRMHRPYKATLEAVLQWLERVLKPETVEDNPLPEKGWMDRFEWRIQPRAVDNATAEEIAKNPWSWPVLNAALTVAIIYPILVAGVQWAVTGSEIRFGGFLLFPEGVNWAVRMPTLAGVSIFLAVRFLSVSELAFVSSKLMTQMLDNVAILAFVGSLAFAFAVLVLGAVEFSGAVALLGSITVAAIISGIAAIALASTGALAGAFSAAFTTLATAVSTVLAVLVGAAATLWVAAGITQGIGARRLSFYLLASFLTGSFIAIGSTDAQALLWAIALVLLPSINAFFDWLSYGWTIFLLRWGRSHKKVWPFLAGLADIAVAAVIFALLATTLVIVFAQINLLRGEVLVDVQAILDDPGAHVWVVAMVASTLLPTLVHLGLAALSVITWVPLPFWGGLVARLDPEQSAVLSNLSAAALALSLMVLYTLPIVAIGGVLWLLWQHSGWVLDGYLWWLQLVLDWMGSPPSVVSA
ncbi:hypothetical protein [Thalassococcus lentus]|uniref:Uncharacterized protein n=1 Tax=Thalassococcus lentus TaxID=1210524 RepID=A0ABT4XX63_9RHOB|nr:hypothetical protein [Thalassococcus lentus]MDA7426541.1 hypothetical protein [Thalassococcus lentus]